MTLPDPLPTPPSLDTLKGEVTLATVTFEGLTLCYADGRTIVIYVDSDGDLNLIERQMEPH